MKKLIVALAVAAAAIPALALDITTGVTHSDRSGVNAGTLGVGAQLGPVRGEAYVARSKDVTTLGVDAAVPMFTLAGVELSAKAGVQRIAVDNGPHGSAVKVGLGAAYPLTKQLSVVGELAHVRAQDAVTAQGGNTASAGLRYRF